MTLEEYEIELVREQITCAKEQTKFTKELSKREKLHQKHFKVMIECNEAARDKAIMERKASYQGVVDRFGDDFAAKMIEENP